MEASIREAEYALDTLKLDGVLLRASAGDHYLGDPVFGELMDELDRRTAVVFLHPSAPPGSNVPKPDLPVFLVEFIFDTTRAVGNLLFSGTLDRCSRTRFIIAHAGGAIPYIAGRLSLGEVVRPWLNGELREGVIPALRRLYFDSAFRLSLRVARTSGTG